MEKHIIVTGTSQVSWKDAIIQTISEASRTIDYLTGVKILNQRAKISGKKIIDYIVDLDLSFTSQPIPRVGFDPDKGFLYSPSDETTEKLRNGLFGQSTSYLDDEYWKDYIVHNLIPVNNGNRMSINELFKKLSLVDKLLAGEILDEEELKEKEAKGGTETESKSAES